MSSEFVPLTNVELFSVMVPEAGCPESESQNRKISSAPDQNLNQDLAQPKYLPHFEEIPELESEESFLSEEKDKLQEPKMPKDSLPGSTYARLGLAQKVFVRPQPETLLTIPRNRISDKMSLDPEIGSSMFEEKISVEKSDPDYEF